MDQIVLKDFTVKCLMGMSKAERVREQPIQVELSLFFDSSVAARSGRLEHAVDYVRILGEVRFILEHGEFILIESAAEAICRYLLLPAFPDSPRADLSAVRLRLIKPNCLEGLATPALEIFREKKDGVYASRRTDFGVITPLHQTWDCSIHIVQLWPSQCVTVSGNSTDRESEMALGAHLFLQKEPVSPGSSFRWNEPVPRSYRNASEHSQTLIHISHPARDPWKQVQVSTPEQSGPYHPVPYYAGVLADYMKLPD